MSSREKIDSVYDFTEKGLVEVKAWLEPWFLQDEDDCLCVPATPPSLSDIILAEPCLAGFWKLNETAGDIAVDSSPGGYDLSPGLRLVAPDWGQSSGPPGDLSAAFRHTVTVTPVLTDPGLTLSSVPALTGALTGEIWVKPKSDSTAGGYVMGQGTAFGGSTGWNIYHETVSEGATRRFTIGVPGGAGSFESDDATVIGNWYHLVVTRQVSGAWNMYVNGVLQTATFSPTYTPGTGFWIGDDEGASLFGGAAMAADLSYAAIYNCALTGDQIAAHYEAGISGGGGTTPTGYVLMTDGLGGTSWQPQRVVRLQAGQSLEVLDSSNATIFRIDEADGSVHIPTGTSVVADL